MYPGNFFDVGRFLFTEEANLLNFDKTLTRLDFGLFLKKKATTLGESISRPITPQAERIQLDHATRIFGAIF
jgi:hypothetical protein